MEQLAEQRLRILFVSAEVSPFARTGGLGDVVGALPPILASHGLDVRVAMPLYQAVRDRSFSLTPVLQNLLVPLVSGDRTTHIWRSYLDERAGEVPVYFIEQDEYFARPGLYGDGVMDYEDNAFRFIFFCAAALALVERLEWFPHVIHCHDWHTGLVPAYLRFLSWPTPRLATAATVFTIHNLAYQGVFPAPIFGATGLPSRLFQPRGMEFHGNVNFMKAGLYYADHLTTVSPTYAEEICTPEFGHGLDGVLRERRNVLTGIVNGADYNAWNPTTDPLLAAAYTADDLRGKAACKLALLRMFGMVEELESPLLGMVTRLTEQKGVDLVLQVLERLFALDANLVILGSGDRQYEGFLAALARRYPDRLGVRLGFNDALAHQIQAGGDCLLMPSRFEPCGLTQMYAMRYGTIPIVRATGGLKDTVTPFDPLTRQGVGFVFTEATADALLETVRAALSVFADKSAWRQLQRNAMTSDFSWDHSAARYIKLYQQAVEEKRKAEVAARPSTGSG
jgi:starch synthase